MTLDTIRARHEAIKIRAVNGITIDDIYSNCVEGFVVKNVERSNGESSYEGRKGDRFRLSLLMNLNKMSATHAHCQGVESEIEGETYTTTAISTHPP
jgi:hypothetical protein